MKEEMSFGEELMNLSASQFMSLMYISEHAPVTMSAIASYLRIELPSATSVINKLSRAKLIKRHASPDDRRLVLISLTERGQDLLKQAKDLRRQKLNGISPCFLIEKIRSFNYLCKRSIIDCRINAC